MYHLKSGYASLSIQRAARPGVMSPELGEGYPQPEVSSKYRLLGAAQPALASSLNRRSLKSTAPYIALRHDREEGHEMTRGPHVINVHLTGGPGTFTPSTALSSWLVSCGHLLAPIGLLFLDV